jgi:RNA polymerase sigma-70 factor (ECF subfamily)
MLFRKTAAPDLKEELDEHLASIWRFALSLSGKADLADDLTQATCLRALEKQHQVNRDKPVIGWLLTICRSIWLNELRSRAFRKTGGLETAKASDLIDQRVDTETNIFAAQVYTSVMALPEEQRATVELVYVQQFTYSEAAAILEIPIGTVMSRLSTARAALAGLKDEDTIVARKGRSR